MTVGIYLNVAGESWWQLGVGALPPLPPPTAAPSLVYSGDPDRAAPLPLSGAVDVDQQNTYVFTTPDTGVRFVDFEIDGVTERTESAAPFDLRGATGASANPLNLPPGPHTVTADVRMVDGRVLTVTASFTVATVVVVPPDDPGDPTPPPPSSGDLPFPPASLGVGLSNPGALTASGSITVNTAGTLIENKDISGQLSIQANNVTVRNCRVRSNSGSFGINVASGRAGTLIEHCEVQMGVGGSQGNGCLGGLGDHGGAQGTAHGSNVTARYCKFTGIADGIKPANYSLYEYNYVRVRRLGTIKHVDGIQGSGRSHYTLRYNYVEQTYSAGHNAALFAQSYNGATDLNITDIKMYGNHVNGGVYTLVIADGKTSSGRVSDVEVYDNVFYPGYLYGYFRLVSGVSAPAGRVLGGWRYDDPTHAPVPRGTI